jgi:hypothetical protein
MSAALAVNPNLALPLLPNGPTGGVPTNTTQPSTNDARYPLPQRPATVLSERGRSAIVGLQQAYVAMTRNPDFLLDVAMLAVANGVSTSDTESVQIVAGLRFLSLIGAAQERNSNLSPESRSQLRQISSHAKARLNEFLKASKALNDSAGLSPPPPVMANIRNNALHTVNTYLGNAVALPNLPKQINLPTTEV